MATQDILGISGQMDISDIVKSFNLLFDNMSKLDVETNTLSARMTKALNEIAQSSDASSKSTQQAFKELEAIATEAQAKLTTTPKKMQDISLEINNASKAVGELKDKLSKATNGTEEWNFLSRALDNQGKTVERLKSEYSSLSDTFTDAQTAANVLNTALDTVNTGRSIANAATGANAGLHAGAAVAIGTESVAHGVNAEKIGTETSAVNASTEAYQKAAEASRQSVDNKNAEAAAIDNLTERIKQGAASEDEYLKAKENAEKRYRQLINEQTELLEKEKKKREEANTYQVVDGKIIDNGNDVKADAADALLERARSLRKEADEITNSLQRLSEAYTATTQKAEGEQKKEEESTNKTLDTIRAKEDELKKLNEQLEQMEAHHANGWGGDFITSWRKGENPFSVISDYFKEGDAIKEQKQQIAEVSAQLEKLRTTADDTKTSTDDMWSGMSKGDISTIIQEDIAQLKILKSEYTEIAQVYGKDSDKAKENKEKQEEITREIIQGKEKLREMGTSYEDAAKEAKKVAKETKNIGKEAENAKKKVGGIFDQLKGALGKAAKGDFSGAISVLGKIGLWGAAIVGVGKSVKWLSQQAEALREAMMPLKSYLDEGTLEELRQQFVSNEYQSSHTAEEMAAAATRWVKYFKGIRENKDAIADVTKTSNDLATVLGTTSEKAADYQLKIAGAFHQTATEAKDNSTIIINASKQSTAKYEEMAQALSSSANRAQNAGVSFKELAAATAYGASTFGSASQAASTYVMMMTRLSQQTKNEYNPSVVGATKALENLAKSHNMNDALTSLLGKRQASLAKVFVQNAGAIAKMKNGLDDEASAAATVAGAEGKIENAEKRLQNAKKALAHEINVNLTPAYATFLGKVSTFVKGIGGISTIVKKSFSPVVDAIGGFIDKLDRKYSNSKFFKFLSKYAKVQILTQIPSLGLFKTVTDYQEDKDKRQKEMEKIFNDSLKKTGASSPGKAYLVALKKISKNGRVNKEDQQYLKSLMNRTRTENNARVTGESLAIGTENAITDKSAANKLKKMQEQQRKFREAEAERQAKELAEAEKTKWDLYVAEKENGIARMSDANEKEKAQRKLDFEKKRHDIEMERKAFLQQNTQAAKTLYEKNPDNKGKEGFYASGLDKNVRLTAEQAQIIQTKIDTLNTQQQAYDLARLKEKTQSLYDYLKAYGTFKEQQLAIAKEYDKKIKAAEDEGDTYKAKSLRAEKQKQVGSVQANEIESHIDYVKVFGEFGVILREQMTDILKDMKAFSKTDTFKSKPLNEQKDFLSRMNELTGQYGTSKWKDINFSQLGKYINDYNEKLKKRNEAEDKLNNSSQKLIEAQEAYEKAMHGTDEKKQLDAKGYLVAAQGQNNKNRTALEQADADLAGAQSDVTNAARGLFNTLSSLDTLLQNMKSGSISSVWNSFVDFDQKVNGGKATKAVTDTIGKVLGKAFEGKSDLVSQIIGAILSLLDTIAEQGIGGIVGGLTDSVLNAINGLLDNILSGKFIEQINGSLIKGIGGILDNVIGKIGSVVSLGALSSKGPSAWFENSNAEKVEKAINDLTDRNKCLQQSIDDLNDTMKNNSGAKSVEAYNEAYKLQKEQNENYKKIAQEQADYHGSHHSWSYYWKGVITDQQAAFLKMFNSAVGYFTESEVAKISKLIGREFNGDIWSLTPEEMKQVRGGAVDIWERIENTGKGGYGENVVEKLNDYIDQADKLQELTDKINESLTQISFSSMRDDFISNLMDMSKTSQDFANDFAKNIQKSVLRYGLEGLLDTDLKNLYEKWGKKMQEGNLSKDDIDSIRNEYNDIVKKGMAERDYWAQITGYKDAQSEQTATSKAIEAITADQASTLIGIGYAMQTAVEQGNDTRSQISADISIMRGYAEALTFNISEMRDIQYEGLGQLQQIAKNTAPIILIREDIANMYKIMRDRY